MRQLYESIRMTILFKISDDTHAHKTVQLPSTAEVLQARQPTTPKIVPNLGSKSSTLRVRHVLIKNSPKT